MKSYTLLFAGAVSTLNAAAQDGQVQSVPGRTFQISPSAQRFPPRGVRGALQTSAFFLQKYADQSLAEKLQQIHEDARRNSEEFIRWTNTGVLYEVTVYRENNPINYSGLHPAYVDGDSAHEIGPGETPLEALFFADDAVRTTPKPGYVLDRQYSYYFFVNEGTDGKIDYEIVPDGTVRKLLNDISESYGDLVLKFGTKRFERGANYAAIAKEAKSRLIDRTAEARIDSALEVVRASSRELSKIQRQLSDARTKAERAERVATKIETLRGILALAELADIAATDINDPGLDLSNVGTPEQLYYEVQTYENKNVAIRNEFTVRYNSNIEKFNRARNELYREIDSSGPPESVKRWLEKQGG